VAGLPAGTKLGRYEVIKHLARGGMADLSVARATGIENFERHVVIKHLRPEQSRDASFVQMFVAEARLAGALHHHNIVQVHDIGQDGGRHFFAMEYVHGEDLRRVLAKLNDRGEQLPIQHVVTIATAVCAALHHAHEQRGNDRKPLGIVHRDVTPGNILVSYDGNVKVVDFGIAKAVLRTSDTAVGMLKGKVPYMAPEQCTGRAIDRRSDVFAFGIVLYELSTVRRLFKGGNEYLTMASVVSGEIPKPTTHRKDLPAELEQIILKALRRDPAQRYQTADEMRIALDQFADKAGLRTSTTALADYMKKLFGERPEPWMLDISPAVETPLDFDKTDVGVVEIPAEGSGPPKLAATRGSLLEHARLQAAPRQPPNPSARTKTPPPLIKRAANAEAEPVQLAVAVEPEPIVELVESVEAAMPAELEQELDAPRKKGDQTLLVRPLAIASGDLTQVTHAPASDRRWWYLGAAAVVALGISIAIMLTGHSVDPPARDHAVPTKPVEPAPAESKPAVVETPPETKPVEPVVETTPVEPTPEPTPEPKPVEPVVETTPVEPPPVVEPTPVKPVVATKPAPRPVPRRPVKKPAPKNPQWDPDALFLKPKK
jgi:serine/threonine protein kinase